jgi:hypothetical protein
VKKYGHAWALYLTYKPLRPLSEIRNCEGCYYRARFCLDSVLLSPDFRRGQAHFRCVSGSNSILIQLKANLPFKNLPFHGGDAEHVHHLLVNRRCSVKKNYFDSDHAVAFHE